MAEATLQAKVNRILLVTFALVALTAIGSIFGYAQVRHASDRQRIADELTRSIQQQVNDLIPSFLLQEQRAGMSLILERIKAGENLSEASVVSEIGTIRSEYPGCAMSSGVVTCSSADGRRTAAVAPIHESGEEFGYLLKAKMNDAVPTDDLVRVMEAIGAVLLLAFGILFWVMARLMSREVPRALSDLLKWIKHDLNGDRSAAPDLKFKELKDLRSRISEILDQHDRARDQAMIGQLTSGIMHDIKTPLSSIVTASLLAAEQPKTSEKRLSRLENLLAVCQARLPVVGAIIESTLDGNRDIHLEMTATDLSETIRDALSLNSDLIQLRKAKVSFNGAGSIEAVPHDPVQLSRVLTNLIKNGLEATAGSEPVIGISLEGFDSKFATIAVEDNGGGIPDDPDRLFRVFRSSKTHGSGLGLLVSRKIVETHGGSITATRSNRFGGARFEVRIPRTPKSQERAEVGS